MSRRGKSAAARAADDAAKRSSAIRPTQRNRIGTCPVCRLPIYDSHSTQWRMWKDDTVRVHTLCLTAPQ